VQGNTMRTLLVDDTTLLRETRPEVVTQGVGAVDQTALDSRTPELVGKCFANRGEGLVVAYDGRPNPKEVTDGWCDRCNRAFVRWHETTVEVRPNI
jgi:hypothetical protein